MLATNWASASEQHFLKHIWDGYDRFVSQAPAVDERDLERSISQLLEPRIRDSMSGFEPYYVQHGSFERETMKPPPAQPPEYDLAFVLRADERVMWPIEAKVVETPTQIAKYAKDIQNEFLTCRYAPFTASGAMAGYLLSGKSADFFSNVSTKLGSPLDSVVQFSHRPNRQSDHDRQVPSGKHYPKGFRCYHIVLDFPAYRRGSKKAS